MQIRTALALFFLCCLACKNKSTDVKPEKFDKAKWAIKNDMEYPYRDKMLKDLIANYKLKGLPKQEVVNLLGEPSRSDNGYLFYQVAEQFFGNTSWPIHTKTLVIKLARDSTVEWRKIHQ